jgi:hypothetical protein
MTTSVAGCQGIPAYTVLNRINAGWDKEKKYKPP